MNKKSSFIVIIVVVGCVIMAIVETILQPAYIVKSLIKIAVFLIIPFILMSFSGENNIKKFFVPNKKGFLKSLGMGVAVYSLIMIVFLLTRNIFDYSAITDSLSADQKVDSRNFIWVAAYISFGNSLLEEFFFRVIAFLKFSEHADIKYAYVFSSVSFAVYHVAMIGGSFPFILMALALFGLAVGGFIFDYFDHKNNDIYNSWLIHMFADIALMNIWFIMIK